MCDSTCSELFYGFNEQAIWSRRIDQKKKITQAIRKSFPRINTMTVGNLLGYNIYLVNYYLIKLLIKQFQNSIFSVLCFYTDTFIIIFQRTNLHYIAHINEHEILHQILKPRYL